MGGFLKGFFMIKLFLFIFPLFFTNKVSCVEISFPDEFEQSWPKKVGEVERAPEKTARLIFPYLTLCSTLLYYLVRTPLLI